jgi:hypothetical protein
MISSSNGDKGTGTCILHAPIRLKPSPKGQVDHTIEIWCVDAGTGPSGSSSRNTWEYPAVDYTFIAPESGTLGVSHEWVFTKCSVYAETEDDSVWPGENGSALALVFCQFLCFKHIGNSWTLLHGRHDEIFEVLKLKTEGMWSARKRKGGLSLELGRTVGPITKGDMFCVRALLGMRCALSLYAARGEAKAGVTAQFMGFSLDITS